MLINKLGIDSDDDIAKLDDRRPAADPKNRESMTGLLQVALKPVRRSELLTTPAKRDATVSPLDAPAAATTATTNVESSHTDVA